MKKITKMNRAIITLILTLVMAFSISTVAFADTTVEEETTVVDAETYYSISTYRVYYKSTEHVYSADRDVTQETLELIESYYMMLPDWVRDTFESNNWYLWVMDSFEEYGYGDNTAGLTSYGDKCVYIKNRESDLTIGVLFHEIGHVMDYELRTNYTRLSQTSEFISYFDEYWDNFCKTFNYSHFQVNEKELFAEACCFYWTDPYKLEKEFPEIFEYIDIAFVEYSGISVLDYFPVNGLYDLFGSLTYYTNGERDKSYTGFADCNNDGKKYYISNGYMIKRDEILEDGDTGNWYYVVNGKVQDDYTGVSNFNNNYGWWYIKNGKVDFSKTSIEPNDFGWWRVVNGKVDFTSNSIEQNDYGWWYLNGGKVNFNYTGVGDYCNDYGWWYIRDGQVDFSVNSVEPNNYGWWYIQNGKVDFNYTGVTNCPNDYGWWYVNNGKVDFTKNSVEPNAYGWWYVNGGKVNFDYTGVSNYANPYGWWYLCGGKVDFSYSGRASNYYGKWNVQNGKVIFA